MAWNAIVTRPACANGLYFVFRGIHPFLLTAFVDSPQNPLARVAWSGSQDERSPGSPLQRQEPFGTYKVSLALT